MSRKKKISIVGAGNAGCITALNYYAYGKDVLDKIQIYYDPNAPIERVGQGTLPGIAALLSDILGINYYNNPIDCTLKTGILYDGWGNKKQKFFHPFPLDVVAVHYVPNLLSKMILQSGHFEVIEKSIQNPEEEIDSDYIFDCRGKSVNNYETDYDELINPLNSVILARKEGADHQLLYTKSVATPDGWTFVIPNIDSVSYGYLYNSNITTKDIAKKNFIDLFDVVPDGEFSFQNYIAKNVFVGERTILNGNRLSFLEPLEATSVLFYADCARYAWDYIFNGLSEDQVNQNIRKQAKEIEKFILWHYQNGSKYDTDFWKYAKSLPFQVDDDFNEMIEVAKNNSLAFCVKNNLDKMYGHFGFFAFKVWYDNVCN